MFKRFKEHEKWRSIIAIEKIEVKLAFFASIFILIFMAVLDIFNKFNIFKEALQFMVGGFLGGFIALLGFSLSAVALVASLFDKNDLQNMEEQQKGGLENMLSNFEYLGVITIITITVLSITYITMEVEQVFHTVVFYLLAFFVIYLIFFTMFYTVSMVSNCVKLYMYKLKNDEEKN